MQVQRIGLILATKSHLALKMLSPITWHTTHEGFLLKQSKHKGTEAC